MISNKSWDLEGCNDRQKKTHEETRKKKTWKKTIKWENLKKKTHEKTWKIIEKLQSNHKNWKKKKTHEKTWRIIEKQQSNEKPENYRQEKKQSNNKNWKNQNLKKSKRKRNTTMSAKWPQKISVD